MKVSINRSIRAEIKVGRTRVHARSTAPGNRRPVPRCGAIKMTTSFRARQEDRRQIRSPDDRLRNKSWQQHKTGSSSTPSPPRLLCITHRVGIAPGHNSYRNISCCYVPLLQPPPMGRPLASCTRSTPPHSKHNRIIIRMDSPALSARGGGR